MKIKMLIFAILFLNLSAISWADESSTVTTIAISLQHVFSMEFYTDTNVISSNALAFTNVDPNKSMAYPEGRTENDGKSDIGIVCKSNAGTLWYFKVQLRPNPDLPADKVKYFVDQPYNRNTGGRADGALAQDVKWHPFSETPTTIYTSGVTDQSNLPYGTLITLSYALDPVGLDTNKSYSAVVTYTMTTVP